MSFKSDEMNDKIPPKTNVCGARSVEDSKRFPIGRKTCAYCKREGHVISDCFKLTSKTRKDSDESKSNGLVISLKRVNSVSEPVESLIS